MSHKSKNGDLIRRLREQSGYMTDETSRFEVMPITKEVCGRIKMLLAEAADALEKKEKGK